MRRRHLLVLIAVSLISAQCITQSSSESGAPLNILFIVVEDLNGWAGFMNGHPGMEIHTPNWNRLAARSMVFTNTHTPAPACAPTRAAILTGVHHARSGVENVPWGMVRSGVASRRSATSLPSNNSSRTRAKRHRAAGKIYHSQAPP